jgi:hypothetical protein
LPHVGPAAARGSQTIDLRGGTHRSLCSNGWPGWPILQMLYTVKDDPQATPGGYALEEGLGLFADADVYVIDLPTGPNATLSTIDLNAANQQTELNASDTQYFKILENNAGLFAPPTYYSPPAPTVQASVVGFGGFDVADATSSINTNGLSASSLLIDAAGPIGDPLGDPAGSDGQKFMAVSAASRGGYFYTSYGGKPIPWMPGAVGMNLGKISGDYSLNWFNGATVNIGVQDQNAMLETLHAAELATGIIFKGGSVLEGVKGITKVANMSNYIVSQVKDGIGENDDSASGVEVMGVIARSYLDKPTVSDYGTAELRQTGLGQTVNFTRSNGVINVGEQITFCFMVTSWSINLTVPDLVFDQIQGSDVDVILNSIDWDTVDVTIGPDAL